MRPARLAENANEYIAQRPQRFPQAINWRSCILVRGRGDGTAGIRETSGPGTSCSGREIQSGCRARPSAARRRFNGGWQPYSSSSRPRHAGTLRRRSFRRYSSRPVAAADTPPQYWGDITLWAKINALADRRPPLVRIEGPAERLPQWKSPLDLKHFRVKALSNTPAAGGPQ